MWIMLRDSFLSIVKKDCKDGELLVRSRRAGDIRRVFGRKVKVTGSLDSDYLYRAVIPKHDVQDAMLAETDSIDYGNFKDSVKDHELHMAYLRVWTAMAALQTPAPYSAAYRPLPSVTSPDWQATKVRKKTKTKR